MLKIRLQRVGRKHEPTFRVVLTDSKNSTKSGRFLEILGSYDPRKSTESFNGARISEWVGKGAQLSDTLYNLLVSHKIIEGKKKNVLPRKAPYKTPAKLAEEKAAAEKAAAEAKAEEDAKAAAQAEKEAAEQAQIEAESAPQEELTSAQDQSVSEATETSVETPTETPAEEPKEETQA